jgi:hypothetical protein
MIYYCKTCGARFDAPCSVCPACGSAEHTATVEFGGKGNMDDTTAIGIFHLTHRAMSGDPYATALCRELARLYVKAQEPTPAMLRQYHPALIAHAQYVQAQSFEVLRETCPNYGPDDGPDTDEAVTS